MITLQVCVLPALLLWCGVLHAFMSADDLHITVRSGAALWGSHVKAEEFTGHENFIVRHSEAAASIRRTLLIRRRKLRVI